MRSIAVITDTDSSLPPEIAARYDIRQVPINLHFGEQTFRACVDIDDTALFDRVDRDGVAPTSSAPSPGQFAEAFQEAFEAGAREILCFCVSGVVSATYSAAVNAAGMFPGKVISVVDTRNLSMGQGYMALAAAEALEAGASKEQAMARARHTGDRVHLYAALSTLKYLALSGRVKSLPAGVADLLNVKPVITLKDGTLDLLERVRTRKRAWKRVIELTVRAAGGRQPERLAVLHIDAHEQANEFWEQLREEITPPDEVMFAGLTPGLSLFGGRGLVGVALVSDQPL
jgi:DegV family protein with EDD domain